MLTQDPIEKLKSSILDLEAFNSRIEQGLVTLRELDEKFYSEKEKISQILPKDSDEWRMFDNWGQKYMWRNKYISGHYAGPNNKAVIDDLVSIIRKILEFNSVQGLEKEEWSFKINESYEARKFVLSILKSATKKIVIIDNYLDSEIFDYLEEIKSNVEIFLLTSDKKPIFSKLFIPFAQKRGNLYARIYPGLSHDRFIFIDDSEIYAFGGSLNTIDKADFMVHKVKTKEQKLQKIKDFEQYWNSGVEIE